MQKKRKKKRTGIVSVLSCIGFFACLALLIYPVASDRWNRHLSNRLITQYVANSTNDENKEAYEKAYSDAQQYNQMLAQDGRNIVTDAQYVPDVGYEAVLNPEGDGMMGYIEIPCIGVTEPIYHYSDDDVLAKGIGHMHGSSLPVGGNGTHCILTGHRGLPSQKLFTDLDKVKIGDRFYLHVLGHTIAYQIGQIRTVLPSEVSDLTIHTDEDLCTLITCTPYGINTHRLLVTGTRIAFDETQVDASGKITTEAHKTVIDPAVYVFAGFLLFAIIIVTAGAVKKKTSPSHIRREKKRQSMTHD